MRKLDAMEKPPQPQPPQLQLQPSQRAGGGGSNVNIKGEVTLTKPAAERIKRDEWSEGAVTSLLDAYESKWLLRNRAKLKGNDWEEVARHVSVRSEGTKSVKTQTQCKNKIESMKKRYRAESNNVNNSTSSWPLYSRMDNLLRCRTASPNPEMAPLEAPPPPHPNPPPPPPPPPAALAAVPEENGQHRVAVAAAAEEEDEGGREAEEDENEGATAAAVAVVVFRPTGAEGEAGEGHTQGSNQEDGSNTLPNRKESAALDTDTSTPRSKIANAVEGDAAAKGIANFNFSAKRRKSCGGSGSGSSEVADSIRSFAETLVKLEQAKMKMYKDSERLRAETEVRRGEMELKRTEIIAKTQLQIAKLLSGKNGKRKFADRNSTLALSAHAHAHAHAQQEAAAQLPPHSLLND
uniref:TSA: Wollemia nobilis Ref_Wollemi_Transcript_928_1942 transcribed RNA sequence n=1 Tax=Wollemia nobilis TaxID=56998 RepID=A0A0C9SB35_9CONI